MIVLDENLPASQRQLLRTWRIQNRQIGSEIGYQGMKDPEIVRLLHRLSGPTFFTLDSDFYTPQLCHGNYALIHLAIDQYEAAGYIRRFLKHQLFNTRAKRMGTVARVSHEGIVRWRLHAEKMQVLKWPH